MAANWRRGGPFQRSDGNLPLILLGAAAVLILLLWVAGELAALLVNHHPVGTIAGAPAALTGFVHPGDPGRWASVGPVAYYSCLLLVTGLAGVPAWLASERWLGRSRAPAHANPARRGYARAPEAGGRPGGFEPGYDLWLGFEDGRPVRGSGDRQGSGTIGPAGSGKTTGLIVPQILTWRGPAVVTSTKLDTFDMTWRQRRRLAGEGGGLQVLDFSDDADVYDDQAAVIGWDPTDGCEEVGVCTRRGNALMDAAPDVRGGSGDAQFWKDGAKVIVWAYFHAAALDGGGIRLVLRWVARQEVEEVARIVSDHETAGHPWVVALRGKRASEARQTVSSFYETATTALMAFQNPAVLERSQGARFDVARFLESNSTLYVVDPAGEGRASPTAPITAAFIEWIVDRAYLLARRSPGRELERRLLLALDEVANIAPIPSLTSVISQGAGQGVHVSWAIQNPGQLRARYGGDQLDTILTNTRYKVLFGGLMDDGVLASLSRLHGEYEDVEESRNGDGSKQRRPVTRPVLPVETLARYPRGQAVLLHRGRAVHLEVPPAPTVAQLRTMIDAPVSTRPAPVAEASSPGGAGEDLTPQEDKGE
jgi:type IV secretion system protein VirD4